ncbi:MAG: hypothetical protein NWE98_01345 [Candidatus Bathyarchaeota archaeon]|nr:hypothetical protein [Candidatus Bathyarchaeota archaeon]
MEKDENSLKWREAQKKAHKTEKNALTFTKYQLNKKGWKYIDFQSKRGFPRTGIIDLIAVKLDRKDCDKLKIMLFQVKGGSARMNKEQIVRLKNAVKKVEVSYNWSEKPDSTVRFEHPID